ncbi:MAG TPA: D-arabinono-1,4-lactone oxidase [Roseiflexaceae bacterium]|nr:D-arabinono-1,4-lactone oxidase [Roseiflexaceae bacterium]
MSEQYSNWAGNLTYSAARLHHPTTVGQVQDLVARCNKLRVLGSRHSFNTIADSAEDLVSLAQLEPVLEFDHERKTVTVHGGITYGQLSPQLHSAGYALHNLASLPHISIAGACATATHGSGDGNRNLASVVAGMEIVTADGQLLTLSREQHGDQFQGAVVGLGGLGVITKLTLDIVPAFEVRQEVYENLAVAQLDEYFDAILSSAYSVSLFTDWQGQHVNQVWRKHRVTGEPIAALAPAFFEAPLAPTDRHPIVTLSAKPCTPQMGVPGPWYDRLPHFRIDEKPSSGEELQAEYFVPRQHAVAALRAVAQLHEQIAPVLMISEVRTIAADTLWMSPCYEQDCVGIHFTMVRDWPAVQKLLPLIEEQLAPFDARPHWGKMFTISPARLQSLYAKLPDFRELLRSYDPQGKFRNAFLDTYIFG